MKRLTIFSCFLFAAAGLPAWAQVVHSANASQFSVTVGGTASAFEPDYAGNWACGGASCPPALFFPVAEHANQPLIGPGVFVDVRFRRWVQLEGEARWLRFNRFADTHEDNYLIGPRAPVYRFWNGTVYAKALVGFSKMDMGSGYHGTFTTTAFGGGLDIKLTKKIDFRAIDAEYQWWPEWGNTHLTPYGASVGVSYKIF